jgi:hypothetical protein
MRISISFLLLLLILMFMIPSVNAYDGIFKILDERYVENVSDLPIATNLNPDKTLTPDLNWIDEHCGGDTSNNCIFGWVDILGYKNSVRIGDTYYVQGNPADSAIIQYETYIRINGRYFLEGWVHDIKVYQSGDYVTAELTATAVLYQIDDSGLFIYANEIRTLYDSEPAPEQYPALNEAQVTITQYNNSMYENVGIKVLGDNYTKISFNYQDKQAVRTSKILHVENNSKGVIYGNMTELEQWKIEGTNISRFYTEILLDGNLSEMDINEFDVRVHNPFTDRKADPENFSIERVEFAPKMSGLLIAVVGMVGSFMIGTLYLFNRTVYRWNIRLF